MHNMYIGNGATEPCKIANLYRKLCEGKSDEPCCTVDLMASCSPPKLINLPKLWEYATGEIYTKTTDIIICFC